MAMSWLYNTEKRDSESLIQGDQKVSVHLTITVQLSGAQRIFDHLV